MLFSILIPAFKKRYLDIAIESCLSQSFVDWEMIIVNDCSPEDLRSTIASYKDKRIVYYENPENCGAVNVVDNWNKCLNSAAGDFVICMGDDDKMDANALSVYAKYIAKYPACDVFHSPSVIIDEEGEELYISARRPEYESATSFLRHRLNGEEQFIGDFCFRRAALLAKGGFVKLPLAWGADDLTALELAKEHGIVNLQEPVFFYRSSSLTISRSGNAEIKLVSLAKTQEYIDSFLDEKAVSHLENLEKAGAKRKVSSYFFLRKMFTVAEDISSKKLNLFKWAFRRRRYNIDALQLLLAIGVSFKKK